MPGGSEQALIGSTHIMSTNATSAVDYMLEDPRNG